MGLRGCGFCFEFEWVKGCRKKRVEKGDLIFVINIRILMENFGEVEVELGLVCAFVIIPLMVHTR